jgi:hypothetical protein
MRIDRARLPQTRVRRSFDYSPDGEVQGACIICRFHDFIAILDYQ